MRLTLLKFDIILIKISPGGEQVTIKVNVIVQKEENWFVARCVENSVVSQGITIEEALDNLKEALLLYYEDETPEIETRQTFLTTMEVAI